jgi:hypothetical protein
MRSLIAFLCSACLSVAADLTYSIPLVYSPDGGAAATFTFTFLSADGTAPRSGQYADGSYWVAPADGDTGVRLHALSATSGGLAQDSALVTLDADPLTEQRGLLNNARNYGNYSSAENLADDLPLLVTGPCVSLVAALQRNEAQSPTGGTSAIMNERVDAYAIVTVLDSPPPEDGANSIRPNITGATKEHLTWDDFDLGRLGVMPAFPARSEAALENVRLRWSHSVEIFGLGTAAKPDGYSEGGRAFRASILHDEYAAGMAREMYNDILALFTTGNSLSQKKPALAAILAWANDIYHARYDYGAGVAKRWTSGAGQHAGKYGPVLLLAALQTDTAKADVLKQLALQNHGADEALRGPQEIRQIRRGVTGMVLWGDGFPHLYASTTVLPTGEARRYWADLEAAQNYRGMPVYGNSSVGKKTAGDPFGYVDGPANSPGSAYFPIGGGATRGLAAMMILMPHVRAIVGSDAAVEFSDRIVRHGTWASPDPIAPPPYPRTSDNIWSGSFPATDFGVTFGHNPADVRFGIEDGLGRFVAADKHGKFPANESYIPSLVKDYWTTIIATWSGETYEDNVVGLDEAARPDLVVLGADVYATHPHPLAEIRYTVNGATPDGSSTLYSGPVTLTEGQELKAIALVAGKTNSGVRSSLGLAPPPPAEDAPTAPTDLASVAVSFASVSLTFEDNADDELWFEVESSEQSGTGFGSAQIVPAASGTGEVGYVFTGLPSGRLRYFRARAVNAAGNSAWSSEVSATTLQRGAPAANRRPGSRLTLP